MVLHKTVVLHIMLFPSLLNFCYFLSSHAQTSYAPYHRHDENGHGRHQPKESHGVVEVILPCVVAEDGENDERPYYLTHLSPCLLHTVPCVI